MEDCFDTPERSTSVLVIDDEVQIQRVLTSVLRARKYRVEVAGSAEEGIALTAEHTPDLIILDLSLPGMSGLEACASLRQWYHGPILVLSVRNADKDKIAALDLGADDYLTKPFSSGELLARLRALLRRARGADLTVGEFRSERLLVDFAKRSVTAGGEPVRLTRTEFDLLALLVRNAGRVVTSRMIVDALWGPDFTGDTSSLRVHISHLRAKIEESSVPTMILTEPGVGFRFVAEGDEAV